MVRTLIGKSRATRHDRLDGVAFLDAFTDVDRDEIAEREAVCDLHLTCVVVVQRDLRKVDVVVLNNGRISRAAEAINAPESGDRAGCIKVSDLL